MKQSKYRGISKETNNWVYGFGWYETDYTEDYLKELGQLKQDAVLLTDSDTIICHIDSIGQYTGLKDLNKQEVYQGHNIEAYVFDALNTEKLIGKVDYSEERHGFVFIPTLWEKKNLWYPLHAVINCTIIEDIKGSTELTSN